MSPLDCKHKDFLTRHNVGYDVHGEGEDRQHMDICKDCDAWRFRIDHILFKGHKTTLGEWHENGVSRKPAP